MIARTFVDSNILIYAHDLDAGDRHRRAAREEDPNRDASSLCSDPHLAGRGAMPSLCPHRCYTPSPANSEICRKAC
jgi:hypothetical protein